MSKGAEIAGCRGQAAGTVASDSGIPGSNLGLDTCSPGFAQAPQVNSKDSSIRSLPLPSTFYAVHC
jgi:hypothetical protein